MLGVQGIVQIVVGFCTVYFIEGLQLNSPWLFPQASPLVALHFSMLWKGTSIPKGFVC